MRVTTTEILQAADRLAITAHSKTSIPMQHWNRETILITLVGTSNLHVDIETKPSKM